MTDEQKQERDRRDYDTIVIPDLIPELHDPLHNAVRMCREEGFTWSEIAFGLFTLVQDAMYDVEIKETAEGGEE